VYLYDLTSWPGYNGHSIVQRSAAGAGEAEHISYRNNTLRTQRLRVVVTGFSIITNQRFAVTGTPLGAPVDEGIAAVTVAIPQT
jgi:hypothetical protein